MVANSLLAYASVNHLHYHFMYIAQPLLASTVVSVWVGVGGCACKHVWEGGVTGGLERLENLLLLILSTVCVGT